MFVKLCNNSSRFKSKGNPKSWIMTITRNTSIDYLRKYKNADIDMTDEIHNKLTINEVMIYHKRKRRN